MVPAIDEEPETYSLGIIQQLSMLSNTTGKGEISMLLLCRQNQKQIFVPRCHESARLSSEIPVFIVTKSALPPETLGKGEISHVIALHVKTESPSPFFSVTNQLCVETPGKGEISHVIALHVKTEGCSSGSRISSVIVVHPCSSL